MCDDVIVSQSVDIGDIDPNLNAERVRQIIRDKYLRNSTVTVILIGSKTFQRKHVDWEISASIRHTKNNPRSGLLGIILPTYTRSRPGYYDHCTIPPRLYDNIKCEYAGIYEWNDSANQIQNLIHEAFLRKDRVNPNNSRSLFGRNHTGLSWC